MPSQTGPEVRAIYSLTEKDLLEAQTRHEGILSRLIQGFGVFLIAGGMMQMFLPGAQYAQSAIPILIGLGLALRLRLLARFAFKRDFAKLPQTETVISDSGIVFAGPNGSSNFNWSAFARYTESKHLFLLYPQSNIFNLIPKRALAPDDLLQVREILQRNLGAKSAAHNRNAR